MKATVDLEVSPVVWLAIAVFGREVERDYTFLKEDWGGGWARHCDID